MRQRAGGAVSGTHEQQPLHQDVQVPLVALRVLALPALTPQRFAILAQHPGLLAQPAAARRAAVHLWAGGGRGQGAVDSLSS